MDERKTASWYRESAVWNYDTNDDEDVDYKGHFCAECSTLLYYSTS